MLLALVSSALAAPGVTIQAAWVHAPAGSARRALAHAPVNFAESIRGDEVLVHGAPDDLAALRAAGWQLRDTPYQSAPPPASFLTSPPTLGGYLSPEAMNDRLAALADDPRAERVLIGWSLQERPIYGLRLGVDDGPSWRILGAHHGDELSSAELALATAEALLDDKIPDLLETSEVWVVPHVNPDGVAAGSRYNARSVDLNRNYSYQWSGDSPLYGAGPFSEPETRAVRGLSLYSPFHAGLSMHSGALNLGWPWNYTTEDSVEERRMQSLAERYDEACDLEDFWITNGAEWYLTWGDTNDWSYAMRGTLDFTLEISATKSPEADELAEHIDAHLPATLAWLAEPVALQGIAWDAETGRPLEVTLQISGEAAPFHSDPVDGAFARILDPGDYSLVASAPGYDDAWGFFQVSDDEIAWVELPLSPSDRLSLRPEPALLSKGDGAAGSGEVEVSLSGLDDLPETLTLTRPGVEPVEVARSGAGWLVDPAEMASGPWTIEWDGGAAPRSLFVGADDDRVQIASLEVAGDQIILSGAGFSEGARAFALQGDDRALAPLPILSLSDGALELDLTGLDTTAPLDLLVVTAGAEVVALDALGDYVVDATPPEPDGLDDTGTFRDETQAGVGTLYVQPTCGCGAGSLAPGALLSLLPLLLLRREP